MRRLLSALTMLVTLAVAGEAFALNECKLQPYQTATGLLAANARDCTIGYAIDTDAFYVRANGAWTAIATLVSLTGDNGGTFANGTNNMWDLSENSETVRFNLGTSNQLTLSSSTAVADLLTAFDVSLSGGASALNFTAASSSVTTTDNSAAGLVLGSTGALAVLTLDTRDAAEGVIVTGYETISSTLGVTGVATLGAGAGALTFSNTAASALVPDNDTTAFSFGSTGLTGGFSYSSEDNKEAFGFSAGVTNAVVAVTTAITLDNSDCGKHMQVTAAFDGSSITLPATIAGCIYHFEYIGAAAGALLDVSPNASDGIYGPAGGAGSVVAAGANAVCSTTCGASACFSGFDAGTTAVVACNSALADTCTCAAVGLSGTDDADVGITKATIRRGESFSIVGDGVDGWYVFKQSGPLANN